MEELLVKSKDSTPEIIETVKNINKYKEQIKYDEVLQDINDIIVSSKDGLNRIARVVRDVRKYSQMSEQTEKSLNQLNDSVIFALGLVKGQLEKNNF